MKQKAESCKTITESKKKKKKITETQNTLPFELIFLTNILYINENLQVIMNLKPNMQQLDHRQLQSALTLLDIYKK